MKFMKIGTKPDTFYTEEATRAVISELPSDLKVNVNNITYLLHKSFLLPKSGTLQQLCYDDSENVTIDLHDIPGGEEAFELCAKYCYGITINLSAHNVVPAFCAAKFLRMTESVDKGNFVSKLEAFFDTCIMDGWKDSVASLQTTVKLPEWSENLGLTRKCIDSIVEKILTPPAKVSWSFTYTRPGYKKRHQSVPKDWWTEDISDLDIDLFRCIVNAVKSTYMLSPQLIGEALHVYACRWLPDTTKRGPPESSEAQTEAYPRKKLLIIESIVSMIPSDRDSVSVGFLLRLLSIANYLGASTAVKTELVRRAGLKLEEATTEDLLFPSRSSGQQLYDTDLVSAVLEGYSVVWRRQSPAPIENSPFLKSIRNVGKLIDSYLQVVAKDPELPVQKFVSLAEALPDIARQDHDGLYKAINTYLKEHPNLSKAEKKRLCRILDCQKLSPEVRAHAVKNERLPLRTVVQVLFFDQEGSSRTRSHKPSSVTETISTDKQIAATEQGMSKLHLGGDEKRDEQRTKRSEGKVARGEIEEVDSSKKGKETRGEENSRMKMLQKKSGDR